MSGINLEKAEQLSNAAKAKARQIGVPMNIAIVDKKLARFILQNGQYLVGLSGHSIRKAKTARFVNMNSGEIGKLSQPGGPLFVIKHSKGGLIIFPGG
ncbi:MAG: GlcG/HbpS family heme-binding protein [Arcticibacter sp.]